MRLLFLEMFRQRKSNFQVGIMKKGDQTVEVLSGTFKFASNLNT